MALAGTPGTLLLRDGDGNPVNVEILLLPSGNLQTQSTPADATGAPYDADNPLPVIDATFTATAGGQAPSVTAPDVAELLQLLIAELRTTNLLLAQAFAIGDDLGRLRAAALAGL
jgi:hypothetical protein